MKLLFLLIAAVGLAGCATGGGSVEPISGDVWDNGHTCYSAFPANSDGLTLITSSRKEMKNGRVAGSNTYVFAYNPANSKLAIFWSGQNVRTCDNLDGILYSTVIMNRVHIFSVQDAGWKETLNATTTVTGRPNEKVRAIVDFIQRQVGGDGSALQSFQDKATRISTVMMKGGTGQSKDVSSVFAELKR